MAIKNKTQYAILGILSLGAGSGYDIKKYCDNVISNVWNENFGHIYPVLKSLLEEGLIEPVEVTARQEKREIKDQDTNTQQTTTIKEAVEGFDHSVKATPLERKVKYITTDKGKAEFHKWLLEPVEYTPVRSEFMLKFLFSTSLSVSERKDMMQEYRKRHEEKRTELLKIEQIMNNGIKEISTERSKQLKATVRYGILSAEAAIKWCEEVQIEIEK